MKVIVGFGNPGSQYNFTRHNFGFLTLDFYAKIHKLDWQNKPKFNAIIAQDGDRLLVKAQTFYNEVGQTTRAIMDFYKLQPQDFLAVCDDFALEFGVLRFRERGSAGGNNGLKSMIAHFNTDDFPRYRLGTANETLRTRIGDRDFVLSKFTDRERGQLPQILKRASDFIANYD